jgi:hypothetical protein
MPDIKAPGQLDFSSASEAWDEWRKRFLRYRSASGLIDKSQQRQIDTLIYVMGPDAEKIINQVTVRATTADEVGDETVFVRTLDGFTSYFQPRDNTLHYSILFSVRVQGSEESNEEFIRALYELVAKCGWPEEQQRLMLRARILAGMKDKELSRELQLDEGVEIAAIKSKMRAKEIILRNQKAEIDGELANSQATVAAVHRGPVKNKSDKRDNVVDCTYCGSTHVRGRCPAYGKRCNNCKQFNHFSRVCKTGAKAAKNVKSVEVEAHEGSDDEFGIHGIQFSVFGLNSNKNGWFMKADLNGHSVTCQIDTGAQVSVMDINTLKGIGVDRIKTTRAELTAYGGSRLKVVGKVELNVLLESRLQPEPVLFYIIKGQEQSVTLLGMPAIQSLGLINKVGAVRSEGSDVSQSSQVRPDKSSQAIVQEYKEVFQGLGKLKNNLELKLKATAVPKAMPPRSVPQGIRGKLKAELARLEEANIICRDNEPSEWLSPPVIVRKPDGNIRLCLDPQYLNTQLVRTQCSMNTTTEIFSRLQNSKMFSCLDGRQGFHQIPLTYESSRMTCFVTPFGKYRFLRCPMGICNAPEIFHSLMVDMVGDIEGVEVYIDDVLVHAPTQELHDSRLAEVLRRCKEAGLTLNKEKSVFSQSKVVFLGHEISGEGVRPSIDKMSTVENMNSPEDRKALERFLGFVNYLAKFLPHLAELTHPLRECCKKHKEFIWERPQEEAFKAIKQCVRHAPTLSFFAPSKPITISADASAHSLGAVILQEGKPVEFAAKSLTECQQRYSQIEKELLAIVFAVKKFKYYCYGNGLVTVETDHKPLIGIMKKEISTLSPRLASMRLELLSHSIELVHKPGKDMVLADTLSRSCPAGTQVHEDLGSDPLLQVCQVVVQSEEASLRYSRATQMDEELAVVLRLVREGWPSFKKGCPRRALPYWNIRLGLTTIEGLLFYGNRLVIPVSLQAEVLKSLHKAHQGVTKMLQRAESAVFWPGIRRRVEDQSMACEPCRRAERAGRKEPLIPTPIPVYPFQKLGMDLFHLDGVDYLMVVDYFSKWPIVRELTLTTSRTVILALRGIFSDWGTPETIVSDNGPQFNAKEFKQFCLGRGINPVNSSPLHPSGNGQVERVIGTVKTMIKRSIQGNTDWYEGLTALRNTPIDGGMLSPARLLQGRTLRDTLPIPLEQYLVKGYDCDRVRELLGDRQSSQKHYHDAHAGPERAQLKSGQEVMFRTAKGNWIPGRVIRLVGDRSYEIRNAVGLEFRRNRVDIRESGAFSTPSREVSQPDVPVRNKQVEPRDPNPPRADAPTNTISDSRSDNPHIPVSDNMVEAEKVSDLLETQPRSRAGRALHQPKWLNDYVTS